MRVIWGDVLQFGFHYSILGYDVYFGEILLTVGALVVFAILTIFGKKWARIFHIVLALLHVVFIVAIFIGVLTMGHPGEFIPFAKTDVSDGVEIFNIVMLAPWMYVGFEAFMYMFNSGGRSSKNVDKIVLGDYITNAIENKELSLFLSARSTQFWKISMRCLPRGNRSIVANKLLYSGLLSLIDMILPSDASVEQLKKLKIQRSELIIAQLEITCQQRLDIKHRDDIRDEFSVLAIDEIPDNRIVEVEEYRRIRFTDSSRKFLGLMHPVPADRA